MQLVRGVEELNAAVKNLRAGGRSVAFVPTMGALHAGHMALVDEGRRQAEAVVASIFVNPKQFGAGEDLDRYPRQEGADAAMLQEAGCDLLWLPGVDDIYPAGFATNVSVAGVSDRWEGASRPGHFDGVATVVARLLLSVAPDAALFGEKDFQQLAVIRHMVADLGIPARIAGVPTVRDADGLALSSRNAYLTPDERAHAVALPQSLGTAASRIAGGDDPAEVLVEARNTVETAGFSRIDYFALVDADTLEPAARHGPNQRLIAAAVMGSTRLIDNVAVAWHRE